MASGWGGLNDIIEAAKRRKEEEEREQRRREEEERERRRREMREALERRVARNIEPAQDPWERELPARTVGPTPAPRREPESPATPSLPAITLSQQEQPQFTVGHTAPQVDTSTPSITSSYDDDDDDTVELRPTRRTMPGVQVQRSLFMPTMAPQEPEEPHRVWMPTLGQQHITRDEVFDSAPAPIEQRIWRGIGEGVGSVLDWWRDTPESEYLRQSSQQRRDTPRAELPSIAEGAVQGIGMAGGLGAGVGAVGGAAAGAFVAGLNQTEWGRNLVLGAQDALQGVSEFGIAVANQPIPGLGISASELISPLGQAVLGGMTQSELEQLQSGRTAFGILVDRISASIGQSQRLRQEVAQQVEQGNTSAKLSLRNFISGTDAAWQTYNKLMNREQEAAHWEQQAAEIEHSNPILAAEYLLRAQELRQMTNVDVVEQFMNPLAEFIYGMVFDVTNVVGPIMGLAGFLPEAQAAARASRATRVTAGEAAARLAGGMTEGESILKTYLTKGAEAAQKQYRAWSRGIEGAGTPVILAPFQRAGQALTDYTWLFARTPESRAAVDTEVLWQGITAVLSGITEKADARVVLRTLVNNPSQLVRGIGGLTQDAMQRLAQSDGLVRWGSGLLGNNDFVRRIPILKLVANEIENLKALEGAGKFNPVDLLSELNGVIIEGAMRLSGGKQPTSLPFGATNVRIRRIGTDSAVLDYVDKNGKMIQRSVEMGLAEAQRRYKAIQDALKPGGKGLLDWAMLPANIQRAIMSDFWLGLRPANWMGNALSATVSLFANDAYTLLPNSRIEDYFSAKLGGSMGNRRMADIAWGTNLTTGAKGELSSGAIDTTARAVARLFGSKDPGSNPVSRFMQGAYDIPYGNTEIRLPGGLAIPFGEGAFYSRAYYVPFARTFNAAIAEAINKELVPRLQQIEGMTPQMIQQIGAWVQTAAESGGKGDVVQNLRRLVGKPEVKMTLQQLGLPKELLMPEHVKAIEWLLMDAAPSQADQVMQQISQILHEARNPAAGMLNLSPAQLGITNWTDVDIAQEAAWVADQLTREAVRAGIDPALAREQAKQVATTYIEGQELALDRIMQDLASSANSPDTWSVTVDFWVNVQKAKQQARQIVDEAGATAAQLNTPEAWQQKWQTTRQTYERLTNQIQQYSEQARLMLQQVLNGQPYTPQHDWWEVIEDYIRFDEGEFRATRDIQLGRAADGDREAWQRVIEANRAYLDNALYGLVGAFQRYPSLENFDIVRETFRKVQVMGAQVRHTLDELIAQGASGEQYARARNQAWNNYFDAGVTYSRYMAETIVYNGLVKDAGANLRWTENGVEYQLVRPSDTPNKWIARRTDTGAEEEFTAADLAEADSPFVVPNDVVKEWQRVFGGDGELLEEATKEVMDDIAESAPDMSAWREPAGTPAPEPAVTAEEPITLEGEVLLPEAAQSPAAQERAQIPGSIDAEYTVTMQEPEFAPRIAGYDDPAAVRAEPRPEVEADSPYTAPPPPVPQRRYTPQESDIDVGRKTGYNRPPRLLPARDYTAEPLPRPTKAEIAKANRDAASAEYLNGLSRQSEVAQPTTPGVPDNNELRRIANEVGIATATRGGRPSDFHLIGSINKRLGLRIKSLDELTPRQRLAAAAALRERALEPVPSNMTKKQMLEQYGDLLRDYLQDEQVSRLSKAEAKQAIERLHTLRQQRLTIYEDVNGQTLNEESFRRITDDLRARIAQSEEAVQAARSTKQPEYMKQIDSRHELRRQEALRAELERIEQEYRGVRQPQADTEAAPSQADMFGETGEDLPIISGMAPRQGQESVFQPQEYMRQESIFDMRPRFGEDAPSRTTVRQVEAADAPSLQAIEETPAQPDVQPLPKQPRGKTQKEPRAYSIGDQAKEEIAALREARRGMEKAWERAVSQWQKAGKRYRGIGREEYIGSLSGYARKYGAGGVVNLNLNRGEVTVFENLYGSTIDGIPIDNLDDVQRYIQQYVDMGRRITELEGVVKLSRRFRGKKAEQILEETRDIFVSAGYTDEEIAQIAQSRRGLLDTLAALEGKEPDEIGMVTYEFAVPSAAHLLGVESDDYLRGAKNLRDWLNRGRKTGNNAAPQVAEVAEQTIQSINELEQYLKKNLRRILAGQPNQLTGAQQLRVLDEVMDWLPNFDNALAQAQRVADRMAGWMMLNYHDRRNIDTILSILFPYHYFWSRMPSRVLMGALSKPALVNFFYEYNRSVALENQQAGVPQRLEGTLPIPGTNARINVLAPLHYAIPAMTYLEPNPFVEEDDSDNQAERWVNNVRRWTPGLFTHWQMLLDVMDGKLDKDYTSVLNNMVPIVGVPFSTLQQRITGQMPSRTGWAARLGFGPDRFDPYRARRATGWIAEREDIDPELLGYANQVIVNWYNGQPVGKNIPPHHLQDAIALAERGVKMAAEDRMAGRMAAYGTTMSVAPWTEEEQAMLRANERYWAAGYNPQTDMGSRELMRNVVDADPTLQRHWAKSGETPGVDAWISDLYDQRAILVEQRKQAEEQVIEETDISHMTKGEINALKKAAGAEYTARIKAIDASIENLKARQDGGSGGGTDYRSPEEREAERVEQIFRDARNLQGHPGDLPDDASQEERNDFFEKLEQYEQAQEDFVVAQLTRPVVSEAERQSGQVVYSAEQARQMWHDYLNRNRTEKEVQRRDEIDRENDIMDANESYFELESRDDKLAYLRANPEFAWVYGKTLAKKYGEVWFAEELDMEFDIPEGAGKGSDKKGDKGDGTQEGLSDREHRNVLYGELDEQWDEQIAYLKANPEFAEREAKRIFDRYGNLPWWYDEVFGEEGEGGTSSRRRRGTSGRAAGSRSTSSSRTDSNGVSWSEHWDNYRALGEDWAAKKQYMLDNPEFARYYIDRYGEDSAWWLEYDEGGAVRTSGTGGFRTFAYSGGGGRNSEIGRRTPMVYPRQFNNSLFDLSDLRYRWRPARRDMTPDWLYAGQQLRPDDIRRWTPPRW